MGKLDKEVLAAVHHEAQSWETSTVLAARKSAATAWRVTAASLAIGVLGLGAATLQASREAPLPLVLRVDNATGIVDRIDSLTEGKVTTTEATDKYFAQRYVQYREGWDEALAQENYYAAALMSTAAEQQRYAAFYRQSPQSPLTLYGEHARVRIAIKGTSFLAPGVASVRYQRIVERAGGAAELTHHTATVTFAYSSGRMSERDRAINPLGFQADYRTDPDTPGLAPQLLQSPPPPQAEAPRAAPPLPPPAALDLRPLQAGSR